MAIRPRLKSKKFVFKRADPLAGNASLETCLKRFFLERDTIEERRFESNGRMIQCNWVDPDANLDGLLFQIVVYVPGENASIIEEAPDEEEAAIDEQDPPPGFNYLDGELYVYVKDNGFLICCSNAREGIVRGFVYKVLLELGLEQDAEVFDLSNVADIDKVAKIEEEGVDKVQLGVSLYAASLLRLEDAQGNQDLPMIAKVLSGVSNLIEVITGDEEDLAAINDLENVNVNLEFNWSKSGFNLNKDVADYGVNGNERVKYIAKDVIAFEDYMDEAFNEEDVSYKIYTKADKCISSSDMLLSKRMSVRCIAKSLSRDHVKGLLVSYYNELVEEGLIQQ